MPSRPDIAAVVLAGGWGRRMGRVSKAMVPLAGRPLLTHLLDRLRPQIAAIAVSANDPLAGDPDLPVLRDHHEDRRGPLAGILAGMDWCATAYSGVSWLVSVPVDCPFLPRDLVTRLAAAAGETGAEVVVAASAGSDHPTVALWTLSLMEPLRAVVEAGSDLSVRHFYQGRRLARVDFDAGPIDPFFNINTPDDLTRAAAFAAREEPGLCGEDVTDP